ncbi:hypothetical protein MJO29_002487 [Puccinia striiformis f. sp. tritici]|uniref:DUF7872 domain-containing protein n=1 Tax=Puccinia striiformis f. sp. tritici PST-78 TaxID=1165861 RepID=A0A0L0VLX2_9BASI|nr:hypothetical protein Pst134EA_005626 [Puccinia striiformis f. sp. tritici]KAI9618771.1 hypothetical protein H4Q26_012021 [Puccinia striiformis f. sp. tritici PST-130]KNF00222.1 hypothetical protein PSTG_06637 [Puccinia striiformis f. sp. tritici PST-78]KAH9462810.1 hypothetical protein Pst134EB_006688 [Puccinia striiformis f. sp. tritici]KAH9471743.1 hypothetical protein Pst134EA_005626 [Puccinia striiformis f. sp. tritici]KAI7964389.1 hypothetical protein MJO29_002487 [Puccinia striiformis
MICLSFRKCATPAFISLSLALSAKASLPVHPLSDVTHGPSIPSRPASNQPVNAVAQNSTLEDCTAYPLDPSTWNRFHWDDYLRSYPNGANLTTQQYAASKGAQNFRCGIGANCNIGQLCSPVKAPDWYILYATQNLNVYLNTLHQVAGEAISLTQNALASVWNDLFPAVVDHRDLEVVFGLSIAAAAIQAVGALFLLLIPNPALLFTAAPFAIMEVINMPFTEMMCASLLPIVLGQSILAAHDSSGPVQTKEFDYWSQFNYRMSQWQGETEQMIANTTSRVFNSGINSDPAYSLSQILANGTFLGPFERKDTFEIQANLKNVTKSIAISRLLRSMNAFVTISDDPHPNKRWDSKDVLSYHSPNGTLMNIIRAVPGKTKAINDFKNGHALFEKHGISAEHIAEVSFQCQQKFGIQKDRVGSLSDLRRHINIQDPTVCSFDLPVCDLRLPELQHQKHKHKRTVKICRQALGLPI